MSETVLRAGSVSVVIPVHNGMPWVIEAVRSVLNQGETLHELIVLDNKSTDGTAEVVRSIGDCRLRVEEQSALVPAWQNWTDACRLATSEFIKLVCADDRLIEHCLDEQVATLAQDERLAAVSGRRRVVTERSRILIRQNGASTHGSVPWEQVLAQTLRSGGNQVGEPACVLFRRDVLEKALPWSSQWQYLIDLEFYARSLRGQSLAILDDEVADFRVSSGSWSRALYGAQATEFIRFVEYCREDFGLSLTDADVARAGVMARRRERFRRLVYGCAAAIDLPPDTIFPKRLRAV